MALHRHAFLKYKLIHSGKQLAVDSSPSDQVLSSCFSVQPWSFTTCFTGRFQWTLKSKKEHHCNTWSKDFHWLHWTPWTTEFQPITLKSMGITLKPWPKNTRNWSKESATKDNTWTIRQRRPDTPDQDTSTLRPTQKLIIFEKQISFHSIVIFSCLIFLINLYSTFFQ